MTDHLKPEDRALIERVLPSSTVRGNGALQIRQSDLAKLLDAAREEGPRTPSDGGGDWVMVPREPTETEALTKALRVAADYVPSDGVPSIMIRAEFVATIIRAYLAAAPEHDGGEPVAWRPQVVAFANLMEAQLRANDHKPGWKRDGWSALLHRLREETQQLEDRMNHATFADYSDRGARVYHDPKLIAAERTAHVANFAMMIADVCGALELPAALSPTGGVKDREAIARIIDHEGYWERLDSCNHALETVQMSEDARRALTAVRDDERRGTAESLAKADAILALPPSAPGEAWRELPDGLPARGPVMVGSAEWDSVLVEDYDDLAFFLERLAKWGGGPTHWRVPPASPAALQTKEQSDDPALSHKEEADGR